MNSVKFYGWKSSSSIEYYLVLKSSECRESLLSETENQMVKIPSYISKLPSLKTVAFSDRLYWVKHYDRTMELIPVFEDFGTSSIYLSEAFI
ncbi:hypothetical protein CANTEDRAFT_133119 [Yamadazyma tenuis ATCC 10573]|nr:uncharacterized protein CANTEDRAFT_133119 [Yamadazyma tenuis ATCC 10573]EGV65708.1 hypothetical protein CANTEDRAFT_133119 [Yamadazyma tenuis ATCC 10573]